MSKGISRLRPTDSHEEGLYLGAARSAQVGVGNDPGNQAGRLRLGRPFVDCYAFRVAGSEGERQA